MNGKLLHARGDSIHWLPDRRVLESTAEGCSIAAVRSFFLALTLLAWPGAGQSRDVNARCRRPCEQYSPNARARTACVRCGLDKEPLGWLFKLDPVPTAAFHDDDWLVRWTAVRADAALKHLEPERRLAQLLEEDLATDAKKQWCATAMLAAGARNLALEAFLEKSPKMLETCKAIDGPVYLEVARGVLDADVNRAIESMVNVAAARKTGPARVVLDLMTTVTAADESLAMVLMTHAERGGPPVGLALLRDATERDTAAVNRLLAIYSTLRDKHRSLLTSSDKDARLQGVRSLAPLAPLSTPELSVALNDAQASVRMSAARAIARGEGRSVTQAAQARLGGETPASAAEKRRWLTLLTDVDDPQCAELTRHTFADATQPDAVRGDALVSLAGCARKQALPDLESAMSSPNVTLQAAVMRAVLLLPREPAVVPLVERALGSTDDGVLAGACEALGAHRLTPLADRLLPLFEHQAGLVRLEALEAAHLLDPRKTQPLVIAKLKEDKDPAVREAAARLLVDSGGPLAVSALASASKTDADDRVKLAATEGLRKLGVTR